MNSNKYLEKVAGLLGKSIRFADDLIGHSAGKLRQEADVLSRAEARGRTAKQALGEADEVAKRSLRARVKTGIGAAGVGTAGFLGLHKYHQHKDNAILSKIDSMYVSSDN